MPETFQRAGAAGMRLLSLALLLTLATASPAQQADPTPFCGEEGVWIQILGGGGPELDDNQTSASYVLFVDNRARLLVDAAPGSSAGFDKAGGRLTHLDALVLTHLHADHAVEVPAFVQGLRFAEREGPLPVIGPDGAGPYPDTVTFVERLIGPEGAFAYLSDALTFRAGAGRKVSPRNVPTGGRQRHGGFGSGDLRLSAVSVHHGDVPALAWRAEIGKQSVVFTGDFNNQKNLMPEFAKGADALVIHHAIPEGTRGEAAELHVTPTQIGQIAAQAKVRMVILGHRMNRTRGLESHSRQAIEKHYDGSLIFANDMECWGL